VAARTDLGGALVLSEFAGAALELRQAYLCNPNDINSIKDAIMRAVQADHGTAAKRMLAMRRYVHAHDVRQWATDYVSALRPEDAQKHPHGTELSAAQTELASPDEHPRRTVHMGGTAGGGGTE
jgi:trehalose 6-phosphate synthase